jgi:hypothetical protein
MRTCGVLTRKSKIGAHIFCPPMNGSGRDDKTDVHQPCLDSALSTQYSVLSTHIMVLPAQAMCCWPTRCCQCSPVALCS